jgi:hypothetical protein
MRGDDDANKSVRLHKQQGPRRTERQKAIKEREGKVEEEANRLILILNAGIVVAS